MHGPRPSRRSPRRLPGNEARPTPPRHVADSAADYRGHASRRRRDGDGGDRRAGSSTGRFRRACPSDHPQFAAHRREHIAANVVATVRNGRVLDSVRAPSSPRTTRCCSTSRPITAWAGRRSTPSSCAGGCPRSATCPAPWACSRRGASDNYYHFLTDVLPRLELLRRAGADPTRTS